MDAEIPVSEARAQFAELVNRVGYGKERIVLTRHGKPLVALVPADEVRMRTDDEGSGTAVVVDVSSRPASGRPDWGIAAEHGPGPRA